MVTEDEKRSKGRKGRMTKVEKKVSERLDTEMWRGEACGWEGSRGELRGTVGVQAKEGMLCQSVSG